MKFYPLLRIWIALAFLVTSFMAFSPLATTPVHAAGSVIVVNTAVDEDAANGSCSLREAIIAANTNANYKGCAGTGSYGADTITFAGYYTITLATSQLPAVNTEIIINGKGAANTIVQAHTDPPTYSTYRVFEVMSTGNLTLHGLTIRNGGGWAFAGGGIYNDHGTLAVTNSIISGNSATFGGGIYNEGGTVMVTYSTISGNSVSEIDNEIPSGGGGIYNEGGTVTVMISTISGNSVRYGNGGGIYSDEGMVTVMASTISGNIVSNGDAGGIANFRGTLTVMDSLISKNDPQGIYNLEGILVVTNSTFFQNSGSGISNFTFIEDGTCESDPSATIANSTFSGNSGQGISNGWGVILLLFNTITDNTHGGVYTNSFGDANTCTQVGSNIIAANMPYDVSAGDSMQRFYSLDYNLVGVAGPNINFTQAFNGQHDQVNVLDPRLGTLTNNGGPTQTVALLPGSPAIDAGDDGRCAVVPVNGKDQRGVARPQGNHCDIGAYEVAPDTVPPTISHVTSNVQNKSYGVGATIPITVKFSEAVNVTGTPKLTLETGEIDRAATYSGGSGTNILTFLYTVQTGDFSDDLDYASTTALALNGGTIRDVWNNNSVLNLPFPGTAGSLGANKAILIDGISPTTLSFKRQNPAFSPTYADALVFRAIFSEAVTQVDGTDFVVHGATTALVTNVVTVDAKTYDVTVSGGDLAGLNGDVGLNLNGSQNIKDLVGNALLTVEPVIDQTYTVDNINLNVDVFIGGDLHGSYAVPVLGGLRTSFASVDKGPGKVVNTKDILIIASERVNLKTNPTYSSYAEVMGLPSSKLTDTYIFPWYNNSGVLSSQLRFGNVGNYPTTVTVKIGGIERGSYDLDPSASTRVDFPNLDSGPVEVKSSNGVPIIAALRVNLKKMPAYSSYAEILGLSASSTASTKYIFPWYNNMSLLSSQLRFGNVGSNPTTVTVKIGGVVRGTYGLAANQSTRVDFAGIDNGPVEVSSSNNEPIIASLRINLKTNPTYSSYNEIMGLPGAAISDTKYLFPWYNNTGLLSSQLRFANVGNDTTTVIVKIGGMVLNTYNLIPNQSMRVDCPAIDTGPVEVYTTNGVPIIASLRVNLKRNPTYSSYFEFMGSSVGAPLGLPGNQLSTTYWFPWYNNTGLLDTQLRFGVP